MKSTNVADLKNRLSHYLRSVRRGERIVVFDRKEAIAQLVPLKPDAESARGRLIREGLLRPGTQDFSRLRFRRVRTRNSVQDSLRAVREDSV